MNQKLIKLLADLKMEQSKSEKFRKQYYMLLNAKQSFSKKSGQKIIHKTKGPLIIEKELLYNEILKCQLKNNYSNCTTYKEKQLFTKSIEDKILKKY